MGFARPSQETLYANRILEKWVLVLRHDRRLARIFFSFVEERLGIPAAKFQARFHHVKSGRVPTTAVACHDRIFQR